MPIRLFYAKQQRSRRSSYDLMPRCALRRAEEPVVAHEPPEISSLSKDRPGCARVNLVTARGWKRVIVSALSRQAIPPDREERPRRLFPRWHSLRQAQTAPEMEGDLVLWSCDAPFGPLRRPRPALRRLAGDLFLLPDPGGMRQRFRAKRFGSATCSIGTKGVDGDTKAMHREDGSPVHETSEWH